MNEKIRNIVYRAIEAQEALLGATIDRSLDDEATLFGAASPFDSMALVSLITHIEELVDAELHQPITLVSEKAMSAHRSPFATVGSLINFIDENLLVGQHG
jgi:acyl carrier protein